MPAPESPLRFTPAREGLPHGQIWKSQVVLGDVNGDGFDDLGAITRLADGPWIYLSDGKGGWTAGSAGLPRQTFCGGGMDFADLNNDGKMDVAIADHCNGVYAFFGDGTGKWTNASSGLPTVGSEDVTVADFNNDGCKDLAVVTAQEEGIRAFSGNCKGKWQESSNGLPLTEWGNGIVSADMNNDGNMDLIAAYSAGPRVYLGNGQGAWREASQGLPAPEIHGLYWGIDVGDVNGDGKLDIAAGAAIPGAEVYLQEDGDKYRNVSGFDVTIPSEDSAEVAKVVRWLKQNRSPVAAGETLAEVKVGKKSVEIQAPGSGTLTIVKGDGESIKAGDVIGRIGILPMNALGVALGDIDKDGHVDLVAAGKTALDEIGGVYGIFVMRGDGQGNWTWVSNSGLPDNGKERTWGVAVGDVNGDGNPDVAAAFGDVIAPTWHSGMAKEATAKGKKHRGPDRGKFGSLEVWAGHPSGL